MFSTLLQSIHCFPVKKKKNYYSFVFGMNHSYKDTKLYIIHQHCPLNDNNPI